MTQALGSRVGEVAKVSRILNIEDRLGNRSRWQLILKEYLPVNVRGHSDVVFSSDIRPQVDALIGMIKRVKQFGVRDIHGSSDGIGFWADKPEVRPQINGNPDDPMLRLSNGIMGFASACFVQAGFKVSEKK